MKKTLFQTCAVLATLTAITLSAEAATLNVGDPAPKLEVSKWVQGDPVTELNSNTTYIVEFWATWCGPCRQSIPHLNETHLEFKDKNVIVIGVDIWEQETAKVEPFVKNMGSNMTYRVAMDSVAEGKTSREGAMAVSWMAASSARGIPTAFLINKEGIIAWIGSPSQLDAKLIGEVQAGTFDIKKAADQHRAETAKHEEKQSVAKHYNQFHESMKSKDWDRASAAVDALEKVLDDKQKQGLGLLRLQILLGRGNGAEASQLAARLSEGYKVDGLNLSLLARELAVNDGVKEHDLALASQIIKRADDVTHGEDALVLDTLALITFQQGDKSKAIEIESKAVEKASGKTKEMLQRKLNRYKEGKQPDLK
jgi:thiol-disulfide isomerase/thioredoxin